MKNFEWQPGYEFTIPNEIDRHFEKIMLGRHRGHKAMVLCRSPFLSDDMHHSPKGIGCVIGVNHVILKYGSCIDYNVGGDVAYWDNVSPVMYPATTFVTGFCQTLPQRLKEWGYPQNVICYTTPPHMPPGVRQPTRDVPRPNCAAHTFSSVAALWLAWYMGCPEIYLAGCHCAMRDGELYGDIPAKELGRDDHHIDSYRSFLPFIAQQMVLAVEALRTAGATVEWPGEATTREVSNG